jgi:titin
VSFAFPDPPGPPQNLRIENLTAKSCTLAWEPPAFDGGSPIKGYYIEKSSGYSSRFVKVTRDAISNTSKTFNDLVEGTEYEYRVVAENEAGLSKPSETTGVFVAKDPYGKPGKPGTPSAKLLDAGSAEIEWQVPDSDGGSPITNYVLEMRESGDKWKTKDENVKETKYVVSGLKEGSSYEFRVSAVNKAGQGPASASSSAVKYGKSMDVVCCEATVL